MPPTEAPFVAVFDIETTDKIDRQPGRFREDKIAQLEISCASIFKVPSELCLHPGSAQRAIELGSMRTFWCDEDGENGMDAMVEMLLKAELIVGYNLAGFDWLVCKKYFGGDTEAFRSCLSKTHDIFSRVRDATVGKRWPKLDTLLELNCLGKKTADGLVAIQYWKDQERELLKEYCESDVRQCARLSLLTTLIVAEDVAPLDNFVFGSASALTAFRFSRCVLSL